MAKSKVIKDRWGYTINGYDELYQFFPTRQAAVKDAYSTLKSDFSDYEDDITVELYQLAEVIKVELEVKEVETVVVKKQTTIKEVVK